VLNAAIGKQSSRWKLLGVARHDKKLAEVSSGSQPTLMCMQPSKQASKKASSRLQEEAHRNPQMVALASEAVRLSVSALQCLAERGATISKRPQRRRAW
jgi:hypothetical protein